MPKTNHLGFQVDTLKLGSVQLYTDKTRSFCLGEDRTLTEAEAETINENLAMVKFYLEGIVPLIDAARERFRESQQLNKKNSYYESQQPKKNG